MVTPSTVKKNFFIFWGNSNQSQLVMGNGGLVKAKELTCPILPPIIL